MRGRVLLTVATVGAVLLGTAAPALAKGADQATIAGPGLTRTIVVGGSGEPGQGTSLSDLAEGSGLFDAMFNDDAATLTAAAPTAALGPRYTMTFRVPGGAKPAMIRQDLYPAAAGGPVTFTPPGQKVFDTNPVASGWFRAPDGFGTLLTKLGVPGVTAFAAEVVPATTAPPVARPVAASTHAGVPVGLIVGLVALVGLLVGGVFTVRHRRAAG
jgi:hypothetical protein